LFANEPQFLVTGVGLFSRFLRLKMFWSR